MAPKTAGKPETLAVEVACSHVAQSEELARAEATAKVAEEA
jgi:hypothetical protein